MIPPSCKCISTYIIHSHLLSRSDLSWVPRRLRLSTTRSDKKRRHVVLTKPIMAAGIAGIANKIGKVFSWSERIRPLAGKPKEALRQGWKLYSGRDSNDVLCIMVMKQNIQKNVASVFSRSESPDVPEVEVWPCQVMVSKWNDFPQNFLEKNNFVLIFRRIFFEIFFGLARVYFWSFFLINKNHTIFQVTRISTWNHESTRSLIQGSWVMGPIVWGAQAWCKYIGNVEGLPL